MSFVPDVMNETIVNVLGLVAGTIVAVATLPQIYRVHKRGRGTDLSVTRQVVTGLGATMQIVYLVYFGLWAVVVPLGCELVFLFYLSCLRAFYERFGREGEADTARIEESDADADAVEGRTPSISEEIFPPANNARDRSSGDCDVGQEPP